MHVGRVDAGSVSKLFHGERDALFGDQLCW
jgi:hypothetical protein